MGEDRPGESRTAAEIINVMRSALIIEVLLYQVPGMLIGMIDYRIRIAGEPTNFDFLRIYVEPSTITRTPPAITGTIPWYVFT